MTDTYIINLADCGYTLAAWPSAHAPRTALAKAIQQGSVTEPGEYLVCQPSSGLLCAEKFTVEQTGLVIA